ncbi:hypothetical protein KBY29_18825 [Ruegeria pomeroyi]|nr:hypothetical protein [Ruegeria pomeroyi]
MYIRDYILEIGQFDSISLDLEVSNNLSSLSGIEVERNSILRFLNFLTGGDTFFPYDVSGSIYTASAIETIDGDLSLVGDQIGLLSEALLDVSVADQSWFNSQIDLIRYDYEAATADLPGFGFDDWAEGAAGFVSSFFGNVADVALNQLESVADIGNFLISGFGLVNTLIYETDDVTTALLATFDRISATEDFLSSTVESFVLSLDDGLQVSDIEELGSIVFAKLSAIWDRFSAAELEDLSALTGDMVEVITGDANVFTFGDKLQALADGYDLLVANTVSSEEALKFLFGVQEDFWLTNSTVDAFDLFDLLGALFTTWKVGGEISDLASYSAGSGDGQDYGGRDIADITIEIKKNELYGIIADDLVPKLLSVFGARLEPTTSGSIDALAQAADVFLESRTVNLVKDLSIKIDQLDVVFEAVIDAYEQLTVVFENALSRLPEGWGADIELVRNAGISGGTLEGTEYAERINGSEVADRIFGEQGNDIIFGNGGEDRIFAGTGDDDVFGGAARDYLKGELGNDDLYGGDGVDELFGDEDNDILVGGAGADLLRGGSGADIFRYELGDIPNPLTSEPIDQILDFNQGGNPGVYSSTEGDRIDISAIVGAAYDGGAGEAVEDLWKLERSIYNDRLQLFVDADGSGDQHSWTAIAYLDGIPSGADISSAIIVEPGATTGPSNAPVPSAPGSYTISPASQNVVEGSTTIEFTITRPDDTLSETVYVSTTVNRGSANNSDYEFLLNEPLVFAAGVDTATVTVNILEDGSNESLETFGLIIQSSPDQPASQYLASASFTIIDDDAAGSAVNFTENNDNEWIEPTGGAEFFNGLGGTDTATLDLRDWTAGINTTTSSGNRTFSSGSDSVAFTQVENFFVIGGSGDDRITTGVGNDGILGLGGDDIIDGGAGIDVMDGGDGDDTFLNVGVGEVIAGGTGTDTVSFSVSGETSDLTINLFTGEGLGGSWTGVERMTGTLGQGNDVVVAGAQLTSVFGGSGTDSLTLDYSGTLADGRSFAELRFNGLSDGSSNESVLFSDGTASNSFEISGFESYNITGTDGDDNIDASMGTAGNTLIGGKGNDDFTLANNEAADVLDGGEGNDIFRNVGINDVVEGGAGTDTIYLASSVAGATTGLTINLVTGEGLGGSWTGVERMTGTLGQGNDVVVAGAQLTSVFGGSGTDSLTLDYSGTLADGRSFAELRFNGLSDGSSNESVLFSDGTASNSFEISGFESYNITGTDGDDNINASMGTAGNTLIGGKGNDDFTLANNEAADVLDGGEGNDIFRNVGINDVVEGGAGTDTIYLASSVAGATTGLTINLVTGEGLGGSWTGVERMTGTLGQGNDVVVAGAQLTSVFGGSGTDSLTLDYSGTLADGRSFAELRFNGLSDGSSNESVLFSDGTASNSFEISGFESYNITGTDGDDNINASMGTAGNTLIGGKGNDDFTLANNDAADVLDGGEGNDIFRNVGINDVVEGGAGTDTIYLASSVAGATTGLTINLVTGEGLGGSWTGVERMTGTLGQGNDVVVAGAQLTSVFGGSGTDSLTLDYSGTLADGRSFAELRFNGLSDGSSNESVLFSDGTASNSFEISGFESYNITGTDGDDNIDASMGTAGNTLIGGKGNDDFTLANNEAADVLDGGEGNDIFRNVGINDVVEGGAGTDTIYLASSVAGATTGLTINLVTGEGLGGSWTGVERMTGTLGQGNDVVVAGAQLTSVFGGSGTDSLTLDYSGTLADGRSFAELRFNGLSDGSSNESVLFSDGTASNSFEISGFESYNITGTDGDDNINASMGTAGNTLIGGKGNDDFTLANNEAADVLDGGEGNDIFRNVGINDVVEGGAGTDTIYLASSVAGATTGLTINLVTGEGLGGSWTGVERMTGTLGQGNDVVVAGAQLTSVFGGSGTDSLTLDYSGTLADGRSFAELRFNGLSDGSSNESVLFSDGTASNSFEISGFESYNITGTDGDDNINASMGTAGNTLIGGKGNDDFTLANNDAADVLDGGEGNDIFRNVGINDVVEGGAGTDTIYLASSVAGATTGLTINLVTGEGLGGSWTGVERMTGTLGQGNDVVVAGAQLTSVFGGSGTDSLTLDYSGTLADGRSFAELRFNGLSDGSSNESVLFSDGTASNSFEISGFESYNITGTDGDDNIDASMGTAGNILVGGAGNDRLIGGNGVDFINGGDGDDSMTGGNGNDLLRGRGGADALIGGSGLDTADYTDSLAFVNVSLLTGYAGGGSGSHAIGDTFSSIENLTGSAFNDLLNGDNAANVLTGGNGNDLLRGCGGADALIGGSGLDTADYTDSSAFVNVSLLTGYAGGGSGSHAIGDTFSSIENLTGSAFNDLLNGDNAANVLTGGNGNDLLRGRGGADTLIGGSGLDTADYTDSLAFVNVSLLTGYAGGGSGSHAIGDTFSSIENLTGSAFNDLLNGDNAANVLTGGNGNDLLRGRGGADALIGGSGLDTADYTHSSAFVNVSLLTGYAGGGSGSHAIGDTFSSIENLTGSAFNDLLNGDNAANVLTGGNGNDLLRGNGGADSFVFAAGFGQDTVADFANGSDKFDLSGHGGVNSFADLTVTASGADAVVADGLGSTILVKNAAGLIDDFDFLF